MTEYLTDSGKALLSDMLAGSCKIEFTKIQMGDGILATGQDKKTMTSLIEPVVTLGVKSASVSDDNVVSVKAVFDNSDISDGFYFREKGVFASDGIKEILFSYANDGNLAEYINPPTAESVEKQIISLYTTLQDTDTPVNIVVKDEVYASCEDLEALTAVVNSNTKIAATNGVNILALDVALTLLQGSEVAGTTDNLAVETFGDDSAFRMASGYYDSENHRLWA